MALLTTSNIAFVFGILGNIVSVLVYLAPLPTFYKIYKKKSTQGFQSIPYSVALFSGMLYLYYAFLKRNVIMLITINSFGTVIESIYLVLFIFYATKKARMYTIKLLVLLNVGALGVILLTTFFLSKGKLRVSIVGWICAVFSVCVFAAPLSIMRRVIKTKSVEFMPFNLSLCLTVCGVMWFFYGLLIKDYYIASPNILGFAFGVMQMILYAVYRNREMQIQPEVEVQEEEKIDSNVVSKGEEDEEKEEEIVIAIDDELEIVASTRATTEPSIN